jgi:hypothetical protein
MTSKAPKAIGVDTKQEPLPARWLWRHSFPSALLPALLVLRFASPALFNCKVCLTLQNHAECSVFRILCHAIHCYEQVLQGTNSVGTVGACMPITYQTSSVSGPPTTRQSKRQLQSTVSREAKHIMFLTLPKTQRLTHQLSSQWSTWAHNLQSIQVHITMHPSSPSNCLALLLNSGKKHKAVWMACVSQSPNNTTFSGLNILHTVLLYQNIVGCTRIRMLFSQLCPPRRGTRPCWHLQLGDPETILPTLS